MKLTFILWGKILEMGLVNKTFPFTKIVSKQENRVQRGRVHPFNLVACTRIIAGWGKSRIHHPGKVRQPRSQTNTLEKSWFLKERERSVERET